MELAKTLLARLFEDAGVHHTHGLAHALAVERHAAKALAESDTPEACRLAVRLAALLHDADDHKLFPGSRDYQNARAILAACAPGETELAVRMIALVSTAANGTTEPPEAERQPWLLYPRHADRLEAIGWTGAVRCWEWTIGSGTFEEPARPYWNEDTPRGRTADEVRAIASPERLEAYVARGGTSASMVEHMYDKLLHLGAPCGNAYLDRVASERRNVITTICVCFGLGVLELSDFATFKRRATVEARGEEPDSDGMPGPRARGSLLAKIH